MLERRRSVMLDDLTSSSYWGLHAKVFEDGFAVLVEKEVKGFKERTLASRCKEFVDEVDVRSTDTDKHELAD